MKHQAKKQTRNQHMPVVIVCILILVLAVMGLGMHLSLIHIFNEQSNFNGTLNKRS